MPFNLLIVTLLVCLFTGSFFFLIERIMEGAHDNNWLSKLGLFLAALTLYAVFMLQGIRILEGG